MRHWSDVHCGDGGEGRHGVPLEQSFLESCCFLHMRESLVLATGDRTFHVVTESSVVTMLKQLP